MDFAASNSFEQRIPMQDLHNSLYKQLWLILFFFALELYKCLIITYSNPFLTASLVKSKDPDEMMKNAESFEDPYYLLGDKDS